MILQSLLNPPLAGDLGRELTLCLQGRRKSLCTAPVPNLAQPFCLSCAGRHGADTSSKRWKETVLNSPLMPVQWQRWFNSQAQSVGLAHWLNSARWVQRFTDSRWQGLCPNSLMLRMYMTVKSCCNSSQKHQQAKIREVKRSNCVLERLEIELDPCYWHKPQNYVIPENNHNSKRRGIFT